MSFIELEILATEQRLVDLCKKYWELDSDETFIVSVSALAREFDVQSNKLSKLVSENCHAYSTQIKCKRCGSKYIFENRSDFQRRNASYNQNWLCDKCRAEENAKLVAERAKLDEARRIAVKETYQLSKTRQQIEIEELSFEHAVCLLSFVRAGVNEDLTSVKPINLLPASGPFAPTKELHYDTLKMLYQNRLIYVHPDSPLEAFIFDENNKTVISQFYLDDVMWALPYGKRSSKSEHLIEDLENVFLNMNWPNHWFEERIPFWQKISLHECLQYLMFSLDQHGFKFTPGEKTNLVFNNLLEDHSVAQAYNFIWRAARDAAAFYMRENVPKQHAANTVVGSIQRQVERSRAEGWEVKGFRRDFRCPQSIISRVLHDTVLHIGEDGFTKPIS